MRKAKINQRFVILKKNIPLKNFVQQLRITSNLYIIRLTFIESKSEEPQKNISKEEDAHTKQHNIRPGRPRPNQ